MKADRAFAYAFAATCALVLGAGCSQREDKAATASTSPPPVAQQPQPGSQRSDATSPPAGAAAGTTAGASSGSTLDNAALTAKVKAALTEEAGPAAVKVGVSTSDGVVTLKGELPKDQIERVVQATRRVDGVRDVVNELTPSSAG